MGQVFLFLGGFDDLGPIMRNGGRVKGKLSLHLILKKIEWRPR